MAKFIFLECRCGRTLRAWEHQAGETIQCWGCREKATVPLPNVLDRLPGELWRSVLELRTGGRVLACFAAAFVMTGALMLGWMGLMAVGIALVVAAGAFRRPMLRGWRLGIGAIRRHPLVTLGVALVLPIGLVVNEAALVAFAFQQNWFGHVTMDLAPPSAAFAVLGGREDAGYINFAYLSNAEVNAVYRQGLRRGFALSWAIPASLIRPTNSRTDTGSASAPRVGWNEGVDKINYAAFKGVCTLGELTALSVLLALLGRWIRLIATLEARRHASAITPSRVDWTVAQTKSAPSSWTGYPARVGST